MLGVPCVTLRQETEWAETLEFGWNALAGSDPVLIEQLGTRAMPLAPRLPYYGEGGCAKKITTALLKRARQEVLSSA